MTRDRGSIAVAKEKDTEHDECRHVSRPSLGPAVTFRIPCLGHVKALDRAANEQNFP